MTHPEPVNEMSAVFSITQRELGAPLHFDPALGTKELDDLIDAYIPGPASIQQKRAQVALDFFSTVEASCLPGPVSRLYHVYQPISQTQSISAPSVHTRRSFSHESHQVNHEPEGVVVSGSQDSRVSAKRARKAAKSPTSKHLPGFSIMTRDGVDITEYASRGPKTKDQREHAALMRKIGSCPSCKRSKQKCDPSHRRPGVSLPLSQGSPVSAPAAFFPPTISSASSQGSVSSHSDAQDSLSLLSSERSGVKLFTALSRHNSSPLATPQSALTPSDLVLPSQTEAVISDPDWSNYAELSDPSLPNWQSDIVDQEQFSLPQDYMLYPGRSSAKADFFGRYMSTSISSEIFGLPAANTSLFSPDLTESITASSAAEFHFQAPRDGLSHPMLTEAISSPSDLVQFNLDEWLDTAHDRVVVSTAHDRLVVDTAHDRLMAEQAHDRLLVNTSHDRLSVNTSHDRLVGGGLHNELAVNRSHNRLAVNTSHDRAVVDTVHDRLVVDTAREKGIDGDCLDLPFRRAQSIIFDEVNLFLLGRLFLWNYLNVLRIVRICAQELMAPRGHCATFYQRSGSLSPSNA